MAAADGRRLHPLAGLLGAQLRRLRRSARAADGGRVQGGPEHQWLGEATAEPNLMKGLPFVPPPGSRTATGSGREPPAETWLARSTGPPALGPTPAARVAAGSRGALRRRRLGLLGLLALLVVAVVGSITLGTRDVGVGTIWQALTDFDPGSTSQTVIRQMRIPRTLVGLSAGMGLGSSGAILQASDPKPPGRSGHPRHQRRSGRGDRAGGRAVRCPVAPGATSGSASSEPVWPSSP